MKDDFRGLSEEERITRKETFARLTMTLNNRKSILAQKAKIH